MLWLSGFRPHRHPRGSSLAAFLRHNAPGLVLLVILAVGLGVSLHRMVARSLYESVLRATLQRRIDASPGCHLVEVRVEENLSGTGLVRAVVRGPTPPTPAQVAEMENALPAAPNRRPVELRIRFVHTTILNRHGELFRDTPFGAQE